MERRWFALMTGGLAWITALMILLGLTSGPGFAGSPSATPAIAEVSPSTAPNDLDTPLTITGAGFTAVPTVYLGRTLLEEVSWLSSTQLTAVVPWGLVTGTYTMTVVNLGGESGSLADAFTVTQGIGVWTTDGPYGGFVHQVLLDPDTPTTMYALAEWVGVFASYDGADTWEVILRDDAPTRLALDAGDPTILYYGGESWGVLLRSMDSGVTWENLQDALGYASEYGCFRAYPAAHPSAPGVVYVGTGSCNGIPVEPGTGGVYRSVDHGSIWISMTVGLTDTDITDIAFHPEDPDQMLVSTFNGNLFTTTDGGEQWTWRANLGSRINRVYFNPYGAHEAWAVMEREPAPPPYLFKSDDPTLTAWTGITVTLEPSITLPIFSLAFYSDTIWAATFYGFTSTDGGATWSLVGEDGVCEVHEFAIDPSTPDHVYAGCLNEGVRKSVDGGATWSTTNDGLAALIPHALAVPADDPETIYAYTWELGILKSNSGGGAWQQTGGWTAGIPNQGKLATDPFTPTRIYLGHADVDNLCLLISEDAGLTWRDVISTMPATLTGFFDDMNVIAPHPLLHGRILAGVALRTPGGWNAQDGGAIFLSDDYAETWQFTWPPPTETFSQVESIAYDAFDPNLVYAGTNQAGLWRSTDAGLTWQAIAIPGVLPPVGISSLATHPNMTHTVYLRLYSMAAGPNPEGQIFVSQDAGATWTELEDTPTGGGLHFAPPQPNMPPYSLYTACDHGLCRSLGVTGANIAWQPVEGAPRPSALASGTDGERVIVYVGSPGGIVSAVTGTLALDPGPLQVIPGRWGLLGGGVYRYTSLQPGHWLYLPLVVRQAPQ